MMLCYSPPTNTDLYDYKKLYFTIQKEEILGMSLTEFDEEAFKLEMREEGIEEGIWQKAHEDAINLLRKEIPVETILECIGLPLKQVLELKKSIC